MPFDDTMFLRNNVDILGFFSDDQIRKITGTIDRQSYRKGASVILQGEISNNFYVIKKGAVEVWAKQGVERAMVGTLKAGDFFGEMSLLDSASAQATIKASIDDTEILMISHESFTMLFRENPALELSLRQKIQERQRQRATAMAAKKQGPPPAAGESAPAGSGSSL